MTSPTPPSESSSTPTPDDLPRGSEAPPPGVKAAAVVRWALVIGVGVVAAGSLAAGFGVRFGAETTARDVRYQCPMHPQILQDHPGECPICHMRLVPVAANKTRAATASTTSPDSAEAAKLAAAGPGRFWCPMHPQVTSDDPNAKCDLCGGMKLLPKPTPPAAGSPSAAVPGLVPVELPPDRVQRAGIRLAPVTRGALTTQVRTVGVVEASERGLAQISPRFSGWIEELFVNETGQAVRRGQALATIYSPDVLQAQQELLSALGWTGGSSASHGQAAPLESMVADARQRLELLGISPPEIDAIVKQRRPQRAIAIRSPVSGHVIGKAAVIGMSVAAGTPLFQVADLSTVWVIADVYEGDLQRVRVGQPARFLASAMPGVPFSGKVQFVHPTLDAASRTLRLRLEFRNRPDSSGQRLRPGMYGNVSLDLPARSGLTIPAEALVDTGDLQYVFVTRDGGRFEPRRVQVGGRIGDRIELLSGVQVGDQVVTTANFLIDSESRLRAAIDAPPRTAPAPASTTPAAPPASAPPAPAHRH